MPTNMLIRRISLLARSTFVGASEHLQCGRLMESAAQLGFFQLALFRGESICADYSNNNIPQGYGGRLVTTIGGQHRAWP